MVDSKQKGKRYERWVCRWWHELTGRNVRRTAAVAPELDNAGVDLTGTGLWVVQCKAVERSIDVHSILERMPIDAGVNVVLHKRSKRGTAVSMSLEDFAYVLSCMEHKTVQPITGAN